MAQSKFGVIRPLAHDTCNLVVKIYCDNTALLGQNGGTDTRKDEKDMTKSIWLQDRTGHRLA